MFPQQCFIACTPQLAEKVFYTDVLSYLLQAVVNCCTALKNRIDPVAKTMPKATWVEIIQECYSKGVDLSEKYMYVFHI